MSRRSRRGVLVALLWLGTSIDRFPFFKPPHGRVTALDLNRGNLVWTAANGDGPRDHPLVKHLNRLPSRFRDAGRWPECDVAAGAADGWIRRLPLTNTLGSAPQHRYRLIRGVIPRDEVTP